jgi:hypothetical protein
MDERKWFVGVDWATEEHAVCLVEDAGGVLGERTFPHSGDGIAEMCTWLWTRRAASPVRFVSRSRFRTAPSSRHCWSPYDEILREQPFFREIFGLYPGGSAPSASRRAALHRVPGRSRRATHAPRRLQSPRQQGQPSEVAPRTARGQPQPPRRLAFVPTIALLRGRLQGAPGEAATRCFARSARRQRRKSAAVIAPLTSMPSKPSPLMSHTCPPKIAAPAPY